jgi:hypothetical protein
LWLKEVNFVSLLGRESAEKNVTFLTQNQTQMMQTKNATAAKSEITLRGSTAIVTEFFGYAVNSIVFQASYLA